MGSVECGIKREHAWYSSERKKARKMDLLFILIRLIEEEIGGKLFVLIAGKVRLDDRIPREAQAT